MLKNFIFDVDRTLIDSYKPELETLKEALFMVTKIEYSDEVMNKLTILTTDEFFNSLGIDNKSAIMKQINHHWGILLEKRILQFFEGMKDVLMRLKEQRCFLGIVTSRTKSELDELAELLECIDLFDCVITSDMVDNPKPNPESINVIIDKYNLNRDETIYIGDSQNDCETAKKAFISFGFANWENKNEIIGYDYLFKTPSDINKIS